MIFSEDKKRAYDLAGFGFALYEYDHPSVLNEKHAVFYHQSLVKDEERAKAWLKGEEVEAALSTRPSLDRPDDY